MINSEESENFDLYLSNLEKLSGIPAQESDYNTFDVSSSYLEL